MYPVSVPRQLVIGAFIRLSAAGWLASSAPSLTSSAVIAHSAARVVPQAALSAMPSLGPHSSPSPKRPVAV